MRVFMFGDARDPFETDEESGGICVSVPQQKKTSEKRI
jgi:hypothetical protein